MNIQIVTVSIHRIFLKLSKNNIIIILALAYELQLDKNKDGTEKRLFFRESFYKKSKIKKRPFKVSAGVCHNYSLYMKVLLVQFDIDSKRTYKHYSFIG